MELSIVGRTYSQAMQVSLHQACQDDREASLFMIIYSISISLKVALSCFVQPYAPQDGKMTLLRAHFAVGLDIDVFVRLHGVHLVGREFSTVILSVE